MVRAEAAAWLLLFDTACEDVAISSTRRRCIGVCRVLCGEVADVDASTRFNFGVGQDGRARSVVAVRLAPMRFSVRSPVGPLQRLT